MRIIGGKYGSISLNSLEGNNTRPTLDKVKGAVFSSLSNKIIGGCFLDLFSGSGGMGIEALSRGASIVYFNELNNKAIKIIKSNLAKIKEDNKTVLNMDYKLCLKYLNNKDIKFDVIYLDPPFQAVDYKTMMNNVIDSHILKDNGVIVVEKNESVSLEDEYQNYYIYKKAKYGSIIISYFKEKEND